MFELTEIQKVATHLHTARCKLNHTDGCGWYYAKWSEVEKYWVLCKYVEEAQRVFMTGIDPDDFCKGLDSVAPVDWDLEKRYLWK